MPGSSLTPTVPTISSPFTFSVSPSAFNATTDTINLGTSHNLVTGKEIWLYPDNPSSDAAASAFGGINPYIKYFAIVVNSTSIKLATTLANAVSGIALDITTPTTEPVLRFSKVGPFGGIGQFTAQGFALPESYPAYAKSEVIFNSSIPVEITFFVPAWSTLSVATGATNAIQLLIREVNTSKYYGITVYSSQAIVYIFYGSTIRSYVGYGSYSSLGSAFTSSNETGYTQKYVINSSRRIECWLGKPNQTLTNVYTTPAFSPNVNLQLEFGSISSIARMTDCNIKYL